MREQAIPNNLCSTKKTTIALPPQPFFSLAQVGHPTPNYKDLIPSKAQFFPLKIQQQGDYLPSPPPSSCKRQRRTSSQQSDLKRIHQHEDSNSTRKSLFAKSTTTTTTGTRECGISFFYTEDVKITPIWYESPDIKGSFEPATCTVCMGCNRWGDSYNRIKPMIKPRGFITESSHCDDRRFIKHTINFQNSGAANETIEVNLHCFQSK